MAPDPTHPAVSLEGARKLVFVGRLGWLPGLGLGRTGREDRLQAQHQSSARWPGGRGDRATGGVS